MSRIRRRCFSSASTAVVHSSTAARQLGHTAVRLPGLAWALQTWSMGQPGSTTCIGATLGLCHPASIHACSCWAKGASLLPCPTEPHCCPSDEESVPVPVQRPWEGGRFAVWRFIEGKHSSPLCAREAVVSSHCCTPSHPSSSGHGPRALVSLC